MNEAKDKAYKLMMQAMKALKKGGNDTAMELLFDAIGTLGDEVDRLETIGRKEDNGTA